MKLNKRFFSIVLFLMFFLSCFINILCNYINCININALSENNDETYVKHSDTVSSVFTENEIYYTDLFFGYPYYLSNEYTSNYLSIVRNGYSTILSEYTDTDLFFSALETASSDAWEILINSAWGSIFGEEFELSSSLKNKAIDNATLSLMTQLYSNNLSDNFFSTSSEVSRVVNCFENLLSAGAIAGGMNGLNTIDESMIITEVADAFPNIDTKEIERFIKISKSNEIVGKFKAGEIVDFVNNVDLSIKILSTYALIYEVSLAEIDTLMGTVDSDTLFYESLSRIRKKISGSFATFAIEEIKKDKSLDAVVDFCDKLSLSFVSDSQLATSIAKIMIKTGTWLTFDIVYPVADAEELLTATYLSQMTQEIENEITEKKIKFSGIFTSSDIVEYEMLYEAYIGAILATLSSTKSCCKNNTDEALIDTYIKSFSGFSYEAYIQSCKNLILNTPIEERVTRQVIEKQYTISDSTFDILPASDEVLEGKIYLFDGKILHGFIFKKAFTINNNVIIDGNVNVEIKKPNNYSGTFYNKLTIPNDVEISVKGDLKVADGVVEIGGVLYVLNNMTVENGYQLTLLNLNSYLHISGDLTTYTDKDNDWFDDVFVETCGVNAPYGTIELKGDLNYFMLDNNSKCTVIFSGENEQRITGYGDDGYFNKFSNIQVLNTSNEGVVLDSDIRIFGNYYSPLKKVNTNGHWVRIISPNVVMSCDSFYSNLRINCKYVLENNINVYGDVIVEGQNYISSSLIISENAEMYISGNFKVQYGGTYAHGKYGQLLVYGGMEIGGNFDSVRGDLVTINGEKSYLIVNGNLNFNTSTGIPIMIENEVLSGIVEVKGDVKNYVVPYNSKNKFIFSGDKLQSTTESDGRYPNRFKYVEIANKSEEGVSFRGTVLSLFNHNQNKYTASGKFPDYDGDGINDNIDPYPLVGDICTITILSEDNTKGTVSEGVEVTPGSEVTISALANNGYKFVCWLDGDDNILSNSVTYTFIAKSNEKITAIFEKNITIYGDVNNDGIVNLLDVIKLKQYLLLFSDKNEVPNGDINKDGKITIIDFKRLINHFLNC